MSPPDKYGKRRQITFRIGPLAEDRLRQVAALFNMKPTEYAKAVLYRELGIFNEPLDQRKRIWRIWRKKHETEFEFDEEKVEKETAKVREICMERSSCSEDDPSGKKCPYYNICHTAGRHSTYK